jgi:nitrite reductase/ring-hydroxylating ferredoxin subunit
MSNYHVEPASKPQALSKEAIKALRKEQVQGLSRRQLLRTSLGAAMAVWLAEVGLGTLSFLWPNLAGGFGGLVRMYQRCPHLGCKPNPCLRNFWLECPCHGSRYDRLGTKAAGAQYGPAPRGMDRFSASVDKDGVLTLDTGKITLGPLPVALGQPGIIPPKSPTGCI